MGEIAEALRRSLDANGEDGSKGPGPREGLPTRELSIAAELSRQRAKASPVAAQEPRPEDPRPVGPAERRAPIIPSIQPVSRDPASARAERISLLDPSTPAAACARRLAQKVKRRAGQRDAHTLVVTSALRGEGKTTTACNLAIALTRLDRSQSVLLVDLDLRRPSVARSLGLSPTKTVKDVLEQRASIDEALLETDVPGLWVLGIVKGVSAPEALLSSQSLKDLIHSVARRFSRVIIDTPPVLSVPDASSVIDAADAFVFVVSARQTQTQSVETALEHLPREKMLGCVLNRAQETDATTSDYYTYAQEPHAGPGSAESPEQGADAVRADLAAENAR